MIKTDKQLQVTKNRLKEFKEALVEIEGSKDMDALLLELQVNAINSQIEDFEKEIAEYELLKKGNVSYVYIHNILDIPEALIKGRLAKGWSQSELAKRLELKEQQIQRYEASNYAGASIPRINEIVMTLGLTICPTKIKVKEPLFSIPEGIDVEMIARAQEKVNNQKTLIPFNY